MSRLEFSIDSNGLKAVREIGSVFDMDDADVIRKSLAFLYIALEFIDDENRIILSKTDGKFKENSKIIILN